MLLHPDSLSFRMLARTAVAAGLLAAAFAVSPSAHAAYPERPIQVIISFPPAGATDVMARAVSQQLAAELGQSVVVENRPGAGGMIGITAAARAPADGYTLYLAAVTNQAIAEALYTNKQATLEGDFVPVAGVGYAPHALVVPASSPATDVKSLIALLKASPGKYNFASQGTGTLSHLESELFVSKAGVQAEHIPYKGSSQALPELANGTSALMFDSITGSLPLVQGGKLKMLAVASSKRVSSLPDVPTVTEAGLPGFEADNLFGFVAPKGTPPAAIATLQKALEKVLASRALVEKVAAQGSDLVYIGPDKFEADIAGEIATWGGVVKSAGITPQ